ncbi:hypothetical protein M5D96_006128, partial [Drosophila gunungcola]
FKPTTSAIFEVILSFCNALSFYCLLLTLLRNSTVNSFGSKGKQNRKRRQGTHLFKMKEWLFLFFIDLLLYYVTMPGLPIWAFLLFTLLFSTQPITRFAVIAFNYGAKTYLLPYCDEWLTEMEKDLQNVYNKTECLENSS